MIDPERHALEAGDCWKAAEYDQALLKRLQDIDADNLPLTERLPIPERAALCGFGQFIAGTYAGEGNDEARMDNWMGFLYGFQMGYDYALRHGALPETDANGD